MLAHHRHESRVEIRGAVFPARSLVIALDADPRHLATPQQIRTEAGAVGQNLSDLPVGAYGRNIVLCVARTHACGAAGATREIDRHRPSTLGHAAPVLRIVHAFVVRARIPLLSLGIVGDWRSQSGQKCMRCITRHFLTVFSAGLRALTRRSFGTTVLCDLRRVRIARIEAWSSRSQVGDRDRLANSATMLSGGSFSSDDLCVSTGFCHVRFCRDECDSPCSIFSDRKNLERIEAGFRVTSGVRVPPAGADRDRVTLDSGIAKNRQRQASSRCANGDEIAIRQTHSFRGRRIHLGDSLPADLGDGIRNLLEPRLVGTTPIANERVRIDDEIHVAARLLNRRSRVHSRNRTCRRRLGE